VKSAIAILFPLLAASGCVRARQVPAPNVVFVCIDTARADHFGCYGYSLRQTSPRLDALAREGTLFLDASATAGWTKPSVPSFLTGTLPVRHGVYEGSVRGAAGEISHALPESAVTLAEVFREAGYDTAAFVRNAQLRPGLGFEQGFDVYQDEAGDAREIRWRAQDWVDARAGERPFFAYLHLLDAHWPWPVPDAYAARWAPLEAVTPHRDRASGALRDAINDGTRTLGEEEREAMLALYDGSIRYVDDQLAEFFAWLERRGLWQDTIVCVVADHGEEFGEHGRVGHGHGLRESLLRVPWILRVPGRAAREVRTPVSLIDVFPTLLSAAGLRAPPTHDGLDRLAEPERARAIVAEHKEPRAYQQSARDGSSKLVRRFVADATAPGRPRPLPGRRYDLELERDGAGGLVAREVKPGEDDVGDVPELKAPLERVEPGRIVLAGVSVELDARAEFYGEVPKDSGPDVLRAGQLVKVELDLDSAPARTRRVKVYAADARPELELRADLVRFTGEPDGGTMLLAGLSVAVDARTAWDGVDDPAHDLSREQLSAWIAAGASGAGYTLRRTLFDLSADPLERAGRADAQGPQPLDGLLDALFAEQSRRRLWGEGDQRELDAGQLEALRALGY
jgi:arylsulfatase A-like enzyme